MGLVLKPGPQEPWTPYRIFAAFTEAGVPREAFSLYPGEAEAGAAVLEACDRAMIFGGTATVDRYRGNPKVQAHGPGFSKILLGDDVVDRLARLSRPDGRKHLSQQRPRLHQLLRRLGLAAHARNRRRARRTIGADRSVAAGQIRKPVWPRSRFPAWAPPFGSRSNRICKRRASTHSTEKYGPRLVEQERASYLRPTIIHAPSPEAPVAQKEYMFPFAAVVDCPQAEMLKRIGPTLVGTVITNDESFRTAATNATNIDRLNLGPIPTTKLNWLQPHEGNLIDFLFRKRALQVVRSLPLTGRDSFLMIPFDFHCPTRIIFGPGKLNELGSLASGLGAKRALVVSDPGIVAAGHTPRGIRSLEQPALAVALFDRRRRESDDVARRRWAGGCAKSSGPT